MGISACSGARARDSQPEEEEEEEEHLVVRVEEVFLRAPELCELEPRRLPAGLQHLQRLAQEATAHQQLQPRQGQQQAGVALAGGGMGWRVWL